MSASTFIKYSFPSSLLAFASVVSVPIASADSSGKPLSYEANGSCYCTDAVTRSGVAGHILPTPIGGQTITQICSRIGSGPGLQIDNGKYNFSAYSDAQCGHGLSSAQDSGSDENCLGISASGASVCGATGSKWDLAKIFSDQSSVVADGTTTPSAAGDTDATGASESTTTIAQSPVTVTNSDDTAPVIVTAHDSVVTEPVKPTAKVAAIAEQLRAFNQSVQDSQSNTAIEDSTNSPTVAAAHSRSAETSTQPGVSKETFTLDSTEYQELHRESIKASAAKPLAPSSGYLTQEEISELPEAETQAVPNLITHHSAELVVTAEEALPGTTTVIVIEPESPPRQMTQDEIKQLPLLTADDQQVADTTEQIEVPVEPTEPEVAAAITPPTPIVPNEPVSPFKNSRLDYSYVGIAPTSFDFGGTGAEIDASISGNNGVAFIGNAGVAEEYTEASIGLGFYAAPFPHPETDIVFNVGAEFGTFDLGITDLDDTGGFVAAFLRTRPIRRIELTGGARYSSFFGGDAMLVATGIFSFTRAFNLFGKVEVGDNDQFSLGFRYFY